MKNINFGIVGYGGIAKTHLLGAFDANINFNLPFNLVPVATVTRSEAKHDYSMFGIDHYNSFEDMCSSKELDFVDICTPNNSHLEYVQKAVQANKAIYCEKPLAHDLNTAIKLKEIADTSTTINACAFIYRMLPAVNMLKQLISDGIIGNIITFKTALFHSGYLSINKGGWRVSQSSGGGAMLDLGVHLVDTVQYVLGSIMDIKAKTHIQFPTRSHVDEHCFCNVFLKNGIQGTIEVSRIMAQTSNSDFFEVYGEKGSLVVQMKAPHTVEYCNSITGTTTLISADEKLLNTLHFSTSRGMLGFLQSAHTASLIEFATSLYNNKKSTILADISDGLSAQKIVMKCYDDTIQL